MNQRSSINIYNQDCMEAMKQMSDNEYDLAICDPPYGIKESSHRKNPSKCAAKKVNYNTSLWKQDKPGCEYFNELFRISKNQIIWGGNYFTENLYESRGWVVWDKETQYSNFADCEMAWTSIQKSSKLFRYRWNGMLQGDMKNKEHRIHPTQKPVQLYKWLLHNFAKEGDKILDTHLGSGSIAIACWDLKFDLTGYEIDKEYYDNAIERIERHKRQLNLF